VARQIASSIAALLWLGVSATPVQAGAAHYRAELATPQARATLVVRDLVWNCGAAACVAPKSNSRPAIDCSALVRQVGELRSFIVEGRALSPAELEKCNARAR
jgi:hypothetical protein